MGTSSETSTAKRSKISCLDNDDCISNLPEDVLANILSRLPTTDAVQTCILSKDWLYKWTSLYNVDLTHVPFDKKGMFVTFVDRVLFFARHLKSFRFKDVYPEDVHPCESSYVQRWIYTALEHDIEILEIELFVGGLEFPCNLLNRVSLRKLDLKLECTLYVVAKNFAPNLTSLHLFNVDIRVTDGNKNTSTVAFTFPVLETLSFRTCYWLNVKLVEIYAPSLTTFLSEPWNLLEEYDYSYVIQAPRLNKFECRSGILEKIILDNGSSVSFATFDCGGEWYNTGLIKDIRLRSQKLLNQFTSLEELTISSFMAEVCRPGPPLHRHDKLKRLTLPCLNNVGQLFHFLDAAPWLKYLNINVTNYWPDYDYGAMESVPSCIVSQLEEVEILKFSALVFEYHLILFLMRKGEKLKKLLIRCNLDTDMQGRIREYLSAMPRDSPCLSINVVPLNAVV